jgi:hypothetical protein
MNRKEFEQYFNYKYSKKCTNCKYKYDVSLGYGKKENTIILCDKILSYCNENTNTKIDKSFVCNAWEAEK